MSKWTSFWFFKFEPTPISVTDSGRFFFNQTSESFQLSSALWSYWSSTEKNKNFANVAIFLKYANAFFFSILSWEFWTFFKRFFQIFRYSDQCWSQGIIGWYHRISINRSSWRESWGLFISILLFSSFIGHSLYSLDPRWRPKHPVRWYENLSEHRAQN